MIEPRIYRAAFLPAVLALVLLMFSLENRPPPLPQGLAADILFDGRLAARGMREIVAERPDRRAGSPGDAGLAGVVAERFEELGFEVERDRFRAEGAGLENVIARRSGTTRRQIVVMAGRDSASPGEATGSAADTGALLELARVLEGRAARKSIVLASVDGSGLGEAGARRFARTARDRDQIEAVLVLSNMAAPGGGSPLVPWSTDERRESIGLQRTAAASLRQELGRLPADAGAFAQLVRLAAPLGIGAQGVLLEEGVEAIRFSGSGELPPPPERRGLEHASVPRLDDMGRGVLRTVSALDGGGMPRHGPRSYVTAARKVVPSWALSLLAFTLLLPALVASIDAVARARRRREPVGRWWLWVLAGAVPFVLGLGVAKLLVVAGLAPDVAAAPAPPDAEPLDGSGAAALGAVALATGLAWYGARSLPLARGGRRVERRSRSSSRRNERRRGRQEPLEPGRAGAAVATAGVISVTALVVWTQQPYMAFLLLPAVHLWLLATCARKPLGRALAIPLVAAGLLPLVVVGAYYLARLSIDPLEGLWYLFLLVTGGHVSLVTALLGCLLLGALGSALEVVLAQSRQEAPEVPSGPRLRGPAGYAGPGSLGGTRSALRR